MKILVTGAGGYLGQGVVKTLLDLGYETIATDINLDGVDDRATKLECNIFDVEDPSAFFAFPEAVLHLAWRDGFIHNSPSHIDDLPNHYHFLEKLIDGGIKSVNVLGSMHEIGFYEGSISEKTACNPQTLYGISKNALRQAVELKCLAAKADFKWLRGFYIVSNQPNGSSIFAKIVQSELNGEKIFPFTSGRNQYDFLDYSVFCKYVVDASLQKDINGIINICSGYPEQLATRVEKFIKDNGYKIELEYGKYPDRPYDSKAIWGDNTKINLIESRLKNEQ